MTPRIVNVARPMTIASPTATSSAVSSSGPHERAVMLEQRVRIGLAAFEADRAVERKRGLHGAQLDHLGDEPRAVAGPHHRRRLDRSRFARRRPASVSRRSIVFARLRRPVAVGRDEDVGGDERLRFRAEDVAHALNHRPQRDDRGDADRDADEEEQQAPPRRPRLAHRHAKDEHHARASRGLPALGRGASVTRPSRSTTRASAMAASSASCVTSTIVVPARVNPRAAAP